MLAIAVIFGFILSVFAFLADPSWSDMHEVMLTGSIHMNFQVNFILHIRVINDWNNLTSDIVGNSSLNNFKSAIDNYFYDYRFM